MPRAYFIIRIYNTLWPHNPPKLKVLHPLKSTNVGLLKMHNFITHDGIMLNWIIIWKNCCSLWRTTEMQENSGIFNASQRQNVQCLSPCFSADGLKTRSESIIDPIPTQHILYPSLHHFKNKTHSYEFLYPCATNDY